MRRTPSRPGSSLSRPVVSRRWPGPATNQHYKRMPSGPTAQLVMVDSARTNGRPVLLTAVGHPATVDQRPIGQARKAGEPAVGTVRRCAAVAVPQNRRRHSMAYVVSVSPCLGTGLKRERRFQSRPQPVILTMWHSQSRESVHVCVWNCLGCPAGKLVPS